jgi:hypothetical protein
LQATKALRWSRGIALLCFSISALEGGEGSASRPGHFLPLGKTLYPLYGRLGGPQGRSGQVRKISPPPGFDPRTVQPVARRYTDWAIGLKKVLFCWIMVEDLKSRVKILVERAVVPLFGAQDKVLNSPQPVSIMKNTNSSYILTPCSHRMCLLSIYRHWYNLSGFPIADLFFMFPTSCPLFFSIWLHCIWRRLKIAKLFIISLLLLRSVSWVHILCLTLSLSLSLRVRCQASDLYTLEAKYSFLVIEVKWSVVTLKFLGTKVPRILAWPYAEGTWLNCDYLIWCLSCTVFVLTCFVTCGCCNVWVFF